MTKFDFSTLAIPFTEIESFVTLNISLWRDISLK